jgi:YHS domain-containing protein
MTRLLALIAALVLASYFVAGCSPKAADEPSNAGTAPNAANTAKEGDDDDTTEDADEPGDNDADGDDAEGAADDDTKTTSNSGAKMELAVYKNAEGKLACPVMDVAIESEDAAFSHIDHEGKRYFFCCNGCPEVFKKDPKKFAK